jgi:2,3-bisphosphoglycerate-dependent phosphoglycerate mutase
MRIYFIRHAQSMNNALQQQTNSRFGRLADPDLTTIGRQQAEVLSAFLSTSGDFLPVDVLYCSLMQRAIQTALPVAASLGLAPHGLYDSHESGGLYLDDVATSEPVGQPGTPPEELRRRYPALILPEDLNADGWWSRPYETVAERVERARRLVAYLREVHGSRNQSLALISHQGFFTHFFFALLGMERPAGFWFTLNNISLTCLDVTGDRVNMVFMNRMDHVRPELWTW